MTSCLLTGAVPADMRGRYQAKASAQLRGILMRLANAMASLPAAMFVDVQQRHTFQLQRYTLLLEDEYQVCFAIARASLHALPCCL